MASRFFYSLTACSLVFSLGAEQFSVTNEEEYEEAIEEMIDAALVEATGEEAKKAAPASEKKAVRTEISPELQKKKPHFVGVRKPEPKAPKKRSSKIKTPWFTSKTQPKKTDNKKTSYEEEVSITTAELPADRPFYVRKTQSASPSASKPFMRNPRAAAAAAEPTEGELYPRGGFEAPRGHIYLTADYLLWRTREEGTEFATAKKINFEYDSGFRVGLGAHMPHNQWDIYANYTRFVPEASKSAQGSFYPLFLFQGVPGSPQGSAVAEAHGHWKIEYQTVDIVVGRAYYISRTLNLHPFFGLKGAWIDQHARFHYAGGFIPVGQLFRTHFENDFKGAGPLIGIDSHWAVGGGFSFFGDLASSLVVGHFDNEQRQYQLNNGEVVHLDNDSNLVSPFLQMIIGLAWDRNFHQDQWHVGLSAGFETQYWWNQNQIEQFTDKDLPIYVRQNGDLSFYGLTVRARFDF